MSQYEQFCKIHILAPLEETAITIIKERGKLVLSILLAELSDLLMSDIVLKSSMHGSRAEHDTFCQKNIIDRFKNTIKQNKDTPLSITGIIAMVKHILDDAHVKNALSAPPFDFEIYQGFFFEFDTRHRGPFENLMKRCRYWTCVEPGAIVPKKNQPDKTFMSSAAMIELCHIILCLEQMSGCFLSHLVVNHNDDGVSHLWVVRVVRIAGEDQFVVIAKNESLEIGSDDFDTETVHSYRISNGTIKSTSTKKFCFVGFESD